MVQRYNHLVIRTVDSLLYENTIKRCNEHYEHGVVINNNRHYEYHCFKQLHVLFPVYPPTPATKQYLDPLIAEFTTSFENRRRIIMFLTRFLNQCKSHSSVGMLLPKSISRSVFPAGISRTDHDDELIEMFKREDEYRLLMAQVTFNSMGL